ncbi:CYTH and CHAD domain-containing protein [Streptomyces somaliensis DSM 40738]|uniref:CYTH and CHAD domain-containing protein n=1 Tax=Streptomyces somaliensis (strain ATCC 33201 / DSM 40738 / JCM 12659 / KCTC 9044 / NCTC 11332 / NRRL B-12077 / IP 733) TaxID=1134445 RepID=A0AA44IC95_STRE0|nr:CYTH and CHAD domain-containing protein [Streptomyces somaliensis]MCQ0022718.1 CYTH and CHAD domain-containing protein [Streptomyces somaliensis DSM 40738]NKY12953.1 CYTH and CHAD domain-containing protein [Streptomyces somaliensis DSM 40738]
MADTKREIERKYEATTDTRVPDLTRVRGVSRVVDTGTADLDAVYHDTPDLRLAAHSVTLRRRTGGDAGWHLKLPVAPGVRDEVHAPLDDDVPPALAALVRALTRGRALVPVVRLRSSREVRHLLDGDGGLLAELSTDTVRAERLTGGGTAQWTEIEVELADGGDPALLDAVDKRLRKAGVRPAASPSKLARALEETGTPPPAARPAAPDTAGGHVLAYLREHADALLTHDIGLRRDHPDAVHRMRVATRRLRSASRSHRKVLDREATEPVAAELKWLAAELGVDRDREVLDERLRTALDAVPRTLRLGPVHARLDRWSAARRAGSRDRLLEVLDGDRYLALLDALDALLADPPLRPAAAKAPGKVLARTVAKDHARVAARLEHALALDPGHDRDTALHEARKAAKRARYAAELADPALGGPARRTVKGMKAVQKLLGDHQDSVVAREALREIAVQANGAGESSFTWGLLHAREEARAADRERELPHVWAKARGLDG